MERLNNWESRLYAFLAKRAGIPFSWGSNDCCLFACDAVMEITGVDIAAEFRGKYHNAFGAVRTYQRYGGLPELVDHVAARFAIPQLHFVQCARRGDVGLILVNESVALGVVSDRFVHAPGQDDLEHVPQSHLIRAWRI